MRRGAAATLGLLLCACSPATRPVVESQAPLLPEAPSVETEAAPDAVPAPSALPHCAFDVRGVEHEPLSFNVHAACPELAARWFPAGGPRGLHWDLQAGTAGWTPRFIDGGRSIAVPLLGYAGDGTPTATGEVHLHIADAVAPAPPLLVETLERPFGLQHRLELVTDAFLDGPSRQGRTVTVYITEPHGASERPSLPVALLLHGFDGDPAIEPTRDAYQISVHDPDNTYWWGYANAGGTSVDYTARHVEHMLGWVLSRYENADRNRVWVHGTSMGGAGALVYAATRPEQLAWVSSFIGQTVPRNHRPRRAQQLSSVWGEPAALPDGAPTVDPAWLNGAIGPWDTQDLTAALLREPRAQEPFYFLRHGKDDRIIHFGAVVQPSPLTGLSAYETLQRSATAHVAVWDESGHGTPDPLLPSRWWHSGWHPIHDITTFVALDRAHVAFSGASHDRAPGDLSGNGRVEWSPNSGFAADDDLLGDTGWSGDRAGALNRGLRWDSANLIDDVGRFVVRLRVLDDPSMAGTLPLHPDEPCVYDALCLDGPITVDVTPRRAQRFRLSPGERVRWRSGTQSGEAVAGPSGVITLPAIEVTAAWRELVVERVW